LATVMTIATVPGERLGTVQLNEDKECMTIAIFMISPAAIASKWAV